MKKHLWLFLLLIIISACSVRKLPGNSNTGSSTGNGPASGQSSVNGQRTFANLEELRQFMSKTQAPGLGGREMMATDSALPAGAMAKSFAVPAVPQAQGGAASESQALRYTETNNQVKGVDEPDIIKTNGQLMFYALNNKVEIIKAYPAEDARLLKSIELEGGINDLFIFNNKLVVYGTPFNFRPEPRDSAEATTGGAQAGSSGATGSGAVSADANAKIATMPIWQGANYTFLKIYNIEQPDTPSLVTDLTFEGSAIDARLINNYLYLITNKYAYGQGGDVIPLIYDKAELVAEKTFPAIRYFDFPYQSYSFTSVNALDLSASDTLPTREIYLLTGNEAIYASAENLYIASTEYLNEQELLINKTRELIFDRLPQKDQELIRQIDGLDEAILSKDEKSNKIYALIMRFSSTLTEAEQLAIGEQVKSAIKAEHPQLQDELVSTSIHKIRLNGLEIAYQTRAQVPGRLLNQFSMDESGGNFRLATTRDRTWSQILDNQQLEADNAVYVLDKDMNKVGSLLKLAPKERIYSARFMGDRAYLVTFVQTDPLFVIDLGNPAEPKILGELKIPGFSNYLHPINNTTLLGLGKDTKTNEWGSVVPTNLKIALFDVSDPAAPKIFDEKTLGGEGSDSAALYDHKAFLFDTQTQILALPVNLSSEAKNQFGFGDLVFNGSIVYKLANNKLDEQGKIDHKNPSQGSANLDYTGAVRRNLIIEGNLYSVSQKYLKINSLANLAELKKLEFSASAPEPVLFRTPTNGDAAPEANKRALPINNPEVTKPLP